MSTKKLTQISGWALTLGAITFTIGIVGSLGFGGSSDPRDYYYNPIARLVEIGSMIVFPASTLLLGLGMIGLYFHIRERIGLLGRYSLLLGALAGFFSSLAVLALFLTDQDPWWTFWMYSLVAFFLGLTLFGVDASRYKSLPAGNLLPVLAGIWFPLFVLTAGIYEAVTGNWLEINTIFNVLVALIIGIGLALLGFQVHQMVRPPAQLAE